MTRPGSAFKVLTERTHDFLVEHPEFGRFYYIKPNTSLPFITKLKKLPPSIAQPPYLKTGGVPDVNAFQAKTDAQVQRVRDACKYAAEVLQSAKGWIKPGITTQQLDEWILKRTLELQCYPSPLGYMGFPRCVCTSVNNVVVHGIPDDRPLEDSDIINVDVTVFHKGFHGDTSATFLVGSNHSDSRLKLVDTTRLALEESIAQLGPNSEICSIGNTIAPIARKHGFTVVNGFVGHGIGEQFHELPLIPHAENADEEVLLPNTTFTIEPILSQGQSSTFEAPDKWTVLTSDGAPCAQFEQTILITNHGCEVLTSL